VDILEAIKQRKSIRDFKDDQVSQSVLREILEVACRAPSAMNTQPWEFIVVAKDVLEDIKRALVERLLAGDKPHSEHSVVGWPKESVYRRRQVDLAKNLFQLMDIQREDTDKRSQWLQRGFQLLMPQRLLSFASIECLRWGRRYLTSARSAKTFAWLL
jgi:nitroreductase